MATSLLFFDSESLRPRWGWLLFLGIVMVFLGTVALVIMPAATLGTILVMGWLLVISGIMETIHSFRVRKWGGLFLHLIGGVLGVLVGLLVVTHPVAGAAAWTLLFASFFTVIGMFRLVAAITLKFPNWGWAVFDGVVTLALGVLLWVEWPWSGLWFLGLAVGVSLILRGWAYVMLRSRFVTWPHPSRSRCVAQPEPWGRCLGERLHGRGDRRLPLHRSPW
jgi:uncharacterized membrane protein HdeD (DUF308 family)